MSGPNSYEVARVAGVSRSVVSLVVNGKADKYRITRQTQERVRAAVRQLGYTPNRYLRDLFRKRRETGRGGRYCPSSCPRCPWQRARGRSGSRSHLTG